MNMGDNNLNVFITFNDKELEKNKSYIALKFKSSIAKKLHTKHRNYLIVLIRKYNNIIKLNFIKILVH